MVEHSHGGQRPHRHGPSITHYRPYIYETRAPHIGHKNHLCDLAESGEATLEQMKDLVRNPKFVCRKCGRAAQKDENLCEPVPL
ncbi:MAG: hypothetical protein JSV20_00635 [Candidatus Bathyarchaeota archaeon]|nr:MAG: hypothetical protein JSV20_00635 [Candidatus Bathyarchaeota archaeon]